MWEGEFSKELDVAVRVVHLACHLCQKVQKTLLSTSNGEQVNSKDDDSLVTVAGNIFFFFTFPMNWVFRILASKQCFLLWVCIFFICVLCVIIF